MQAQQAALLRAGIPGVSAARLAGGAMAAVVERNVLQLYTLLRVIQNFKVLRMRRALAGRTSVLPAAAGLGRTYRKSKP